MCQEEQEDSTTLTSGHIPAIDTLPLAREISSSSQTSMTQFSQPSEDLTNRSRVLLLRLRHLVQVLDNR